MFSKKFNLTFLLWCVFILALWASEVKGDCDWDDDRNEWNGNCNDIEISVGAIVGIIIGGIVLLVVIPTLICFCCAWACFRGRKSKGEVHTYIVPAPQPGSYPQQPVDPNQQPPYNYGSNPQGSPGYGYNMAPAPPPYSAQPQLVVNQYQNPPYPTDQYQNNPPPQAGWQASTN